MFPWLADAMLDPTMGKKELFDASPYQRLPKLDAVGLLGLGKRLLAEAPPKLPEVALRASQRMGEALAVLASVHGQLPSPRPSRLDRRPADRRVDSAWSAGHDRLKAWTRLPASKHPEAEEAIELMGQLFAEGLTFLALPYESEWIESNKRIEWLGKNPARLARFTALVGEPFVAELQEAHALYTEALGMDKPRQESAPDEAGLREPMDELSGAILRYARALVGLVDEDKPETVAMVTKALQPITEAREHTTGGGGGGGEEEGGGGPPAG